MSVIYGCDPYLVLVTVGVFCGFVGVSEDICVSSGC